MTDESRETNVGAENRGAATRDLVIAIKSICSDFAKQNEASMTKDTLSVVTILGLMTSTIEIAKSQIREPNDALRRRLTRTFEMALDSISDAH